MDTITQYNNNTSSNDIEYIFNKITLQQFNEHSQKRKYDEIKDNTFTQLRKPIISIKKIRRT